MDSNWKNNHSIHLSNPMFRYPAASKVLPTLDPSAASEKMFDLGGGNFIFSSRGGEFPHSQRLINPSVELAWSKEATNTIVSSEEMHEDSDEIDALLYSDSDEEASTGHSPLETVTGGSEEEVASTGHSPLEAVPAKRRRIDNWYEVSVADTASSNGAYYEPMVIRHGDGDEDDAESICEGGLGECEGDDEAEWKRAKRERIQETVGVLRRIIPGGKGKDAAAVIDEAISYLKSLKLQARAMESASIL